MKFEKIIDLKHWQKVQTIFSSLIGISLKTIGQNGELIAGPSNFPAICSETVAASAAAKKKCSQWYPKFAVNLKTQPFQKYYEYVCPLGLVNFAMPVIFDKEASGYLIAGPVVFENSKHDVHLTQKIQEAGIAEEKFFECFNKLPAVNTLTISNAIEFLNSITLFMSRFMELHSAVGKADIALNKEKVAELLRIFLDMAMKLCDAERGSVMVFEKSTQELSIKDAKGLSDEVVSET
ncbi:PocR ligand-binding domain-containing protein, partial [Patescibacteria group bacterium]|nr:PocR ligand-binding domain-containing protein [Patescibacteria group bacterium]